MVPGIRYSPVSVISSLQIDNIGVLKIVDGTVIPEAYDIKIGMTDLLTESRQIFAGAIGGEEARGKVRAITDVNVPGAAIDALFGEEGGTP